MQGKETRLKLVRSACAHEVQQIGAAARMVVGLAAMAATLSAVSVLVSGGGPVVAIPVFAGIFFVWLSFAALTYSFRTSRGMPAAQHPLYLAVEGAPHAIVEVLEGEEGWGRTKRRVVSVRLANDTVVSVSAGEDHEALMAALKATLAEAGPASTDTRALADRVLAPRRARRRSIVVMVALMITVPAALLWLKYWQSWVEYGACHELDDRLRRQIGEAQIRDVAAVNASMDWPAPPPVDSPSACPPMSAEPLVYERFPEVDFPAWRPADTHGGERGFPERGPRFISPSLEYFSWSGHSDTRERYEHAFARFDEPRPFVDIHQSTYRDGGTTQRQELLIRVLDLENRSVICVVSLVLEAPYAPGLTSALEQLLSDWLETPYR